MTGIKEYVDFYRRLGLRPLPSMSSEKRPTLKNFQHFWDTPVPEDVYKNWRATNIQLMTGVRDYGRPLVVVDIDGRYARSVWDEMCLHHRYTPQTWAVETGGGGLHLWFLGDDVGPSRQIWGAWHSWNPKKPGGSWFKHQEIRVLSDRRLVVAPPSTHVETGKPYRFADGMGPDDFELPSAPPEWLRAMPPVKPPVFHLPTRRREAVAPVDLGERDRIIAGVRDKVEVARRFGLRIAGRPDSLWVSCHAIDRDDASPSCCLNSDSGVYIDHQSDRRLAFPDLIAELGGFEDWSAALQSIASFIHPEESR